MKKFRDYGEYNPHSDEEISEREEQIEKERKEIERFDDMQNPIKYKGEK